MDPVHVVSGTAVPLDRSDVDTDQIIPSDWLKKVERTGFGKGLFSEWRDERDFVLNKPEHAGATILIAGPNFGTGSSREHAVWALRGAGITCVIASSYARIFFRNSLNNGFLSIECPGLADKAQNQDELEVDLEKGVVRNLTQKTDHPFVALTPFVEELLSAGGLLPYIARKMGKEYKPVTSAPAPDVKVSQITPARG